MAVIQLENPLFLFRIGDILIICTSCICSRSLTSFINYRGPQAMSNMSLIETAAANQPLGQLSTFKEKVFHGSLISLSAKINFTRIAFERCRCLKSGNLLSCYRTIQKTVDNASSYRPISILCVAYKMYERLIWNQIQPITESFLP